MREYLQPVITIERYDKPTINISRRELMKKLKIVTRATPITDLDDYDDYNDTLVLRKESIEHKIRQQMVY